MSEFDHWQPVLSSAKLRGAPVEVEVCGRSLVLFRENGGKPAALDNVCPHRRMRLSAGHVVGGRLQCAYHGWTYDSCGNGESPGTPKLHAQARHYAVREDWQWIWIKSADSAAEFPTWGTDGYTFIGSLEHEAPVPLEIVLDNFTEVEHTPTTHALLGFELSRMSEVVTEVSAEPDRVRTYNAGPQKKLSPVVELVFGVRTGDTFVDDWTTFFSPVYAVYEQYWKRAADGNECGVRWRNVVFFTPLDSERTMLTTLAFARPPADSALAKWLMFKPLMLWFVDREVQLDMTMLAKLADKRPTIEGMKLSRFDKVLGLHRERIDRIYRGKEAKAASGI